MMKKRLEIIAKYHGYQAQSFQIIEEMSELVVAISKLHRKKLSEKDGKEVLVRKDEKEYKDVVEELADVEIMVDQLKFLLDCREEVDVVKDEKISREIRRIREREKK